MVINILTDDTNLVGALINCYGTESVRSMRRLARERGVDIVVVLAR